MEKSRNFSFIIQKKLLDQIDKRAFFKGTSRNEEVRQLLHRAMGEVQDADVSVDIPQGEVVKRTVWLPCPTLDTLEDRARRFGRAAGREFERLLAHSIESGTQRELAILQSMIERRNLSLP